MRIFESNENKVEYKRATHEIIKCRGKPEILIAEGVSILKLIDLETEKCGLLRKDQILK